jgi:hypothetical protein
MLVTIIFFLLIIIILTYYYYHYLQNHFWYNFRKNLGKTKFYSGKLHINIYSKKNLKENDINNLVQLYKNYLEGVIVDKEKIENFLSIMPNPEFFFMKVNSIYYGAVMNSIIEIKYKNNTYLSNFVDNAIINKNYRDKGIFKELMNYVSNYSNEMNAKFIIFKIDKKPIPSFYEFNLVSNYYYCLCPCPCPCPFKKGACPQIETSCPCPQIDTSCYCPQIETSCPKNKDQFFKYKNSKNIIILSCPLNKDIELNNLENRDENFGVIPFFKETEKTTMIFKRNSPESIELLYIYNPIKESISNIMQYLFNNYTFDIFFVDDIGNNSHLLKAYPNLFKIAYPVYHYILGLKEKIPKENFFYYF